MIEEKGHRIVDKKGHMIIEEKGDGTIEAVVTATGLDFDKQLLLSNLIYGIRYICRKGFHLFCYIADDVSVMNLQFRSC